MQLDGSPSIEADIHITDQRPVWVLCHPHPLHGGSMTNKIIDQIYQKAVQKKISVVRFNFRGVGNSQGEFDQGKGEVNDLALVLAYLEKEHHIHAHQVHLIGYSFGAYIATCMASQKKFSRLTLIAPAVGLFTFPEPLHSLPMVIWMPVDDEIVDPKAVYDYCQGLEGQCQLVKIPKANHFFVGKTVMFLKQFFAHDSTHIA